LIKWEAAFDCRENASEQSFGSVVVVVVLWFFFETRRRVGGKKNFAPDGGSSFLSSSASPAPKRPSIMSRSCSVTRRPSNK